MAVGAALSNLAVLLVDHMLSLRALRFLASNRHRLLLRRERTRKLGTSLEFIQPTLVLVDGVDESLSHSNSFHIKVEPDSLAASPILKPDHSAARGAASAAS